MDYQQITTLAQTLSGSNPLQVVLQQKRYPGIDMKLVAQQLEGQAQASVKWPTLAHCKDFFYPPRINREQSSSEATALYKASLVGRLKQASNKNGIFTIADLTGGMGIDSFTIAQSDADIHVDYVEYDAELSAITEHNRSTLNINNMHCHCSDSISWLQQQSAPFNLLYIDPARRDSIGRKVVAFEDCQPNILEHWQQLAQQGQQLMIKASPMVDIDHAVSELKTATDVYVVAMRNECKELLFLCGKEDCEAQIHCIDISGQWPETFSFTRNNEQMAVANLSLAIKHYLYEPHAALMKAGPYKLISQQWQIGQLGRNTHLYSSDTLHKDFPGRIWEVVSEIALNRRTVGKVIEGGRAHVIVRNYPIAAAALQQQLGLKEGGEQFIIATTIGSRKTGLLCKSI